MHLPRVCRLCNGDLSVLMSLTSKNKFIVFEGIDGCGKTTQIKRLTDHFRKEGVPCLLTKEPTNGPLGNLARRAVCGLWDTPEDFTSARTSNLADASSFPGTPLPYPPKAAPTPEALALLFAADRAEHIARTIRPALESGSHVFCDRFVYSNIAYQGMEISVGNVLAYNEPFLIYPDLTLFIDTPPEECTRRIIAAKRSLEVYDGTKIAHRIRAAYFEAFKLYGNRMPVVIIDGSHHEEEVFNKILEAILL